MLELQPLAHAFLHPVRALHGLGNRAMKAQRALLGQRVIIEHRQRKARVIQHLADLALCLGVGVKDAHVPAVQKEPRGPSPADDAATDYASCFVHFCGHFRHRNFLISIYMIASVWPSTASAWPLIFWPAGPARNSIWSAMSSAVTHVRRLVVDT